MRLLVLLSWLSGLLPDSARADPPRCTEVIGFSQSAQWYLAEGGFEAGVENARWQLLWNPGAGVDRWQDPDYVGWSQAPVSPCASAASAPDRVLLTVSGPYGSDEAAWAAAIEATLDVIRARRPGVGQILLQPVVGGPGEQDCFFGEERIRASWQHRHIDAAIASVSGGDGVAGYSPEVADCSEYADALGHLTPAGATGAGARIATHYAALDAAPIPALGGWSGALLALLLGARASTRRSERSPER